jgi:hypothetical protein
VNYACFFSMDDGWTLLELGLGTWTPLFLTWRVFGWLDERWAVWDDGVESSSSSRLPLLLLLHSPGPSCVESIDQIKSIKSTGRDLFLSILVYVCTVMDCRCLLIMIIVNDNISGCSTMGTGHIDLPTSTQT